MPVSNKSYQRQQAKIIRSRIRPRILDQAIAWHQILLYLQNNPKHSIGIYASISTEFPTDEMIVNLLKRRKIVAIPKVQGREMTFHQIHSLADIEKRPIPRPKGLRVIQPNILLVPLLAYDSRTYRLGYGGGFYDRYIQKNRKKTQAVLGLAYAQQRRPRIAIEQHDQKLDAILGAYGL